MKSQTYFLNLMYDRGNVYKNVRGFFSCAKESEYKKLLDLTKRKSKLNDIINLHMYCANSRDFNYFSYLNNLSLSKLMIWYSLQLSLYKNEITEFSNIKSRFENFILSKQYEQAKIELETAREKFGMSLWLIECYSVLIELSDSHHELLETLDNYLKSYYNFIKIKNNLNDDDILYRKRTKGIITNSEDSCLRKDYYFYKLCVQTPQSEESWRNILIEEGKSSTIDIYLVFIECLQYYSLDPEYNKLTGNCLEILQELDVPVLKTISFVQQDNYFANSSNSLFESFIKAIDVNDYNNVISIFFSNDCNLYECFSAYRIVATAFLFCNKTPGDSNKLLTDKIVRLIYNILSDKLVRESANKLMAIARLLHTFQIHKSICVFVELTTKLCLDYRFLQHINTIEDLVLFKYEDDEKNPTLIPYKSIYSNIEYDYLCYYNENKEIIEKSPTFSYQRNCYNRVFINNYVQTNDISSITKLLVESIIDNSSLIYTINPKILKSVMEDIENKINSDVPFGIQEICYLFNFPYFKDHYASCFLSFLEDNNCDEPLDLIKLNIPEKLVNYFLVEICQKNMLANIYWLFKSSEEVDLYRIKICNYIINSTEGSNTRLIKREKEELTKNIELKKSLIDVDKSHISINFNEIYLRTIEDIKYQLEIYNSSKNNILRLENNDTFAIVIDNKFLIVNEIYNIYAKEFCFCKSGLDESLSTRVRHGTLSNQLLRTFSDNDLTCDGHGKNAYFDELIKIGHIDESVRFLLLDFGNKINEKLNQLVKITLKVFFDTPIEGALFDYQLKMDELAKIYATMLSVKVITADDVVTALNNVLVEKTNGYLDIIKNTVLPELLQKLINDIDTFGGEIAPKVLNKNTLKDIEKKLTDCKTSLQQEINTVSKWFNLSEQENWKDFTFEDLIDMCTEIDKKLFSGFEKVNIVKEQEIDLVFKGNAYRQCIDIALMLFNNAICHSGYEGDLSSLKIQCSMKTDSKSVYFMIQNNLSESIDLNELQKKAKRINDDYRTCKYLEINTRQEGGMGLYKVMSLLHSAVPNEELFCVSTNDNMFMVELKMSKEIICSEKSINC